MTTNLTPDDLCDHGHFVLYPGPHHDQCRPYVPPTEEKRQADAEAKAAAEAARKMADQRAAQEAAQKPDEEDT